MPTGRMRQLRAKYRLLKRLTKLVYLGEPRKPISRTQLEWWVKLRNKTIRDIRRMHDTH